MISWSACKLLLLSSSLLLLLSLSLLFDYVVHATGNKVPGKPGAGEFFVMSALAKLGATILTYPILLVKSRLQAASKHTHADLQYSGTYDALNRIWQKEGWLLILPSEIQTALFMHCTERLLMLVAMKELCAVSIAIHTSCNWTSSHGSGIMSETACRGLSCFGTAEPPEMLCDAGFLGFYDGLRAKIVQSVLAAALLMSIKEELTNTARVLLAGVPEPVVAAAEKIKDAAEIVQMNATPTK